MSTAYTTMSTPFGPLTVVVTEAGAVRAAGFTDDPGPLLHPGESATFRPDLGSVSAAVRAYVDGEVAALDEVPVEQPPGGEFLDDVRAVLRRVQPGAPVTYTELAGLAGRPAAVRAAAAACARNQVALFVPCHRVLRTDGGLGGYRWGVDVKRWLLRHEAHHARLGPESRTAAPDHIAGLGAVPG